MTELHQRFFLVSLSLCRRRHRTFHIVTQITADLRAEGLFHAVRYDWGAHLGMINQMNVGDTNTFKLFSQPASQE